MRARFWVLLLLTVFACQDRKQTTNDHPDAVRDLLIDKSFWQKRVVTHSQDRPVSIHSLTITNTSQHYVYQRIKIRFDYYDRAYHRIDSAIHVVERVIEPRTAVKIDTLETKLPKEGAIAATATIINASAD